MSHFARLAPGDGTVVMMIQIFVQITLIVLLALGIERLLARRHAAARHGVWFCGSFDRHDQPGDHTGRGPDRRRLGDDSQGPVNDRAATPSIAQPLNRPEPLPFREGAGVVPGGPLPPPSAPPMVSTPLGRPIVPRRLISETGADESVTDRTNIQLLREQQPALSAILARPKSNARAPSKPTVSLWQAVAGALVVGWLIGVVVLSARLIGGVGVLAALRRSARPVEIKSQELADVLAQVRAGLGVARLPVIASSPRLAGPVALGVLKPMVILPEGWFESVAADSLCDLLIHECAHLVPRDPLIGILQRLAELIYWPHPLVHFLNHRLSRAREEACDDLVISHGDAIAYARTLLTLAERFDAISRPKAALALMNPRWNLERRVDGILDPRRNTVSRTSMWKLIAVALALVVPSVAVAGVRWAQSQPPENGRAAGIEEDRQGASSTEPSAMRWPIRGVVVDEAGKPVAGADARLMGRRVPVEGATTGPDGTFVIQANDPIMPKSRLIATSDDGRLQGMCWFSESSDSQVPAARKLGSS